LIQHASAAIWRLPKNTKGKLMITTKLLTGLAGTTVLMAVASAAAAPVDPIRLLEETYEEANSALMRGDATTWNRLMPLAKEFVLFSPFGGKPSRFADYTPERIDRMGRFFKNGTFDQEVVQVFASGDIIVLATIERANVAVGDIPQQDWALRVTSVFKREGRQWKLAHRHADPFVEDVSIAESARFARGDRAVASK
jgi:ketosteroid isomerase-like protein